MAKPNYQQQKNQKDQAKRRKKEEKLKRKSEKRTEDGDPTGFPGFEGESAEQPAAGDQTADGPGPSENVEPESQK